ncbi:hypothetical protein [Schleiferilactobacillus harbinensis]|uniref:hypothetical protein n=1 Tax=Schleiferilactobacillus harbinensis TaxID=304207 RepID=UPI00215BF4BE|nr:hypothetical protein [Schleiferilactobacillus harbinensis]
MKWQRNKASLRTKAKKTSAPERVFELKNKLEDFDYFGQNTMVNMHWTSDQFWNADYFGLMELLNAKPEKDRPVDPGQMFEQYKQQEKG